MFGSEEFKEFGGSAFNDSFSLSLNGTNLALLNDGNSVTINNLVPNPNGPFNPDYIDNPAGPGTQTKLDGFTKILTFEGLLNQNERNTLTINITDISDGNLDSATFIKAGSLGVNDSEDPNIESVPEPASLIGILGVAGFGIT